MKRHHIEEFFIGIHPYNTQTRDETKPDIFHRKKIGIKNSFRIFATVLGKRECFVKILLRKVLLKLSSSLESRKFKGL